MRRASPPLEGHAPAETRDAHQRVRVLFENYFDFIWRVLRRLGTPEADADDAAQQVFMIAAQKLNLIEEGKAKTFLYGIALRVASNTRRASRFRLKKTLEYPAEPPVESLGPDYWVELRKAWSLLDELLALLPDELRRVLVLVEMEQLEISEIAELEGIPVGTAASRVRRARKEFHQLLARTERRNPFSKVAK